MGPLCEAMCGCLRRPCIRVSAICKLLYKLSPLEEANKKIQGMLEHEIILLSESPYGAPLLLIPKKDGSLRFCIDNYWLNKQIV